MAVASPDGSKYYVIKGRPSRSVTNPSTQVVVDDSWIPSLQAEEAADDSDKKLTVPADTEWIIESIWIELITSATANDRQLVIEIQDAGDDVVFQWRVGAVQPASQTRYYALAPHLPNMAAFIDTDYLSSPFPRLVLPTGFDIRIYDNNAVDAAADDMTLQVMVSARAYSAT